MAGAVAAVCVVLGFHLPVFDPLLRGRWRVLPVRSDHYQLVVWALFIVLLVVVLTTAETLPLQAALLGGTETELSAGRGAFLKTRQGWEASLQYLVAIWTGSVLPYSMALLFIQGSRFRWASFGLFTAFTLVSLQKAQFVQAFAPVMMLIMQRRVGTARLFLGLCVGALIILWANTYLARGELSEDLMVPASHSDREGRDETANAVVGDSFVKYFSADYVPGGTVDHLVWRAFAVPIFTAADSFRVFDERLDGQHQFGATSSFLAPLMSKITGLPRISFDAMVFEYQWNVSDVGRSNSVYFVEAFVNFGWVGIVVFSGLIGLFLRMCWIAHDDGLLSIWPLFVWNVFQAGLIGTMLSNGFILLVLIVLFVKIVNENGKPAIAA